jgi:phospholipid-binding lipoprotein MlaA
MRGVRGILCAAALAAGLGAAPALAGDGENDPIEGFNRKIFWFNDKLDVYVLEPVAKGWDFVAPDPVQKGVSNFFYNLRFPVYMMNDLLQGKPIDAGKDIGRFAVNTTVGVLGFMDPATGWGMPRNNEDFGQTLGVWGVPIGPYLVLPIVGPSSPRDAAGLAADYAFSVTPFFVDQFILMGARVVDAVNERSRYIKEVRDVKESAFDYYSFMRNAYFQRRKALVEDSREVQSSDNADLYTLEPEPEPLEPESR